MAYHIIRAGILLIATQLAKYPRVLYVKPSNKAYVFGRLNCVISKWMK